MNEPPRLMPTIKLDRDDVLPALHSTLREETGAEIHVEPEQSEERNRLMQNYQEILTQEAIFYPVCYRFQRELGRGRQGRVFLCQRQGARGCVTQHAIKLFDPGIYSTTAKYWTDMGRIASQVSALQTVRSPNLIAMDTYDEVNGVGYLQMELVNGVDMRVLLNPANIDLVKRHCAPAEWEKISSTCFHYNGDDLAIQPGVAIYILRMMLRGLESLHEAGFIHSDIKPSNVMIDRLGYVQLIDYGRASRPREQSRILLGSPLYMAPESHLRQPGVEQSDLFSVGVVALEILSGRPLHINPYLPEDQLLEIKRRLPDEFENRLPDYVRENKPFVEVLRRFIQFRPEDRFNNAQAAETDKEGLRIVHKQLIKVGQDTDYSRALGHFMTELMKLRS